MFVVGGCLKWPEIFSVVAPRASGVSFNKFLPLSNSTCMWKKQTPSPVYIKHEGREAKHCLFICQVPWQRTELTCEAFPLWSLGASFPILTCPAYAQRLMLFANHTLWNSPKRSKTCRATSLSAAFTTASYIANSVRFRGDAAFSYHLPGCHFLRLPRSVSSCWELILPRRLTISLMDWQIITRLRTSPSSFK